MRAAFMTFVSLALLCAAGCGDDDEPELTCADVAAKIAGCDPATPREQWLTVCTLAVLSDACLRRLDGASCTELFPGSPAFATCFPPCDESYVATCNSDDTLTDCVSELGGVVTYRCGAVCTAQGDTYTGVCASEHQGVPSESGGPVCWCD